MQSLMTYEPAEQKHRTAFSFLHLRLVNHLKKECDDPSTINDLLERLEDMANILSATEENKYESPTDKFYHWLMSDIPQTTFWNHMSHFLGFEGIEDLSSSYCRSERSQKVILNQISDAMRYLRIVKNRDPILSKEQREYGDRFVDSFWYGFPD